MQALTVIGARVSKRGAAGQPTRSAAATPTSRMLVMGARVGKRGASGSRPSAPIKHGQQALRAPGPARWYPRVRSAGNFFQHGSALHRTEPHVRFHAVGIEVRVS